MGGCGVVLLLVLFCFVGPLIYRTNQTTVNLNLANLPPGPGHPLGTDEYGIDILGRLMVGGQSSLELGFSVGHRQHRDRLPCTAPSPAWSAASSTPS